MTEENKNLEEQKCNCFCQSKSFKKFLVIACGTFVGVYAALSLFAAIHKPPMPMPVAPCPCAGYHQMVRPFGPGPQHFDRGHRGDFHKKMMKHHADRPLPPRADRPAPEVDD